MRKKKEVPEWLIEYINPAIHEIKEALQRIGEFPDEIYIFEYPGNKHFCLCMPVTGINCMVSTETYEQAQIVVEDEKDEYENDIKIVKMPTDAVIDIAKTKVDVLIMFDINDSVQARYVR